MKSKKKIKIGLILLGIIFLLSAVSNLNFNNKNFESTDESLEIDRSPKVKKAGFWDLTGSPIRIDNDGGSPGFITWEQAVSLPAGWCKGSGTWSDPYVLENITINGQFSGACIHIKDSKNVYFKIQNCTLYHPSKSGTNSEDKGILLEYVNNGTIKNNTIFNAYEAMRLYYCDNNTISNNHMTNSNEAIWSISSDKNRILNNTIKFSSIMGVYLEYNNNYNLISGNLVENTGDYAGIWIDWNSDNNTIVDNTIINNENEGISITFYCYDNIIVQNNLSNNNIGIYLDESDRTNITENIIRDNVQRGIFIEDVISSDNIIYNNYFLENGIHAYDDGVNNDWNYNNLGNYWDNHTSPDSDNDGVVDTPYIWIEGSAGSEDRYPLAEMPFYFGEKIHIDDTGVNAWTWSTTAKLKEWCSGTGTIFDPYIIDDLEIGGSGSGTGILIENSNVFFKIKDCKVSNCFDGIKLKYTSYGTLVNNKCSFNNGNGIYITNECENNTIIGNTVSDNDDHGMFLDNNCNNNTILGNTLNDNINNGINLKSNSINNTIRGNLIGGDSLVGLRCQSSANGNRVILNNFTNDGIHARDDGSYNIWDNGNIGNYWDNYNGADKNDNGIGDTPFNIPGAAGSQDFFPIWWDAPVLNNTAPSMNAKYYSKAPKFEVRIEQGLGDYFWYEILGSGKILNLTKLSGVINENITGSINQTLWSSLPYGKITIRFYCNDTRSYIGYLDVVIIKDLEYPDDDDDDDDDDDEEEIEFLAPTLIIVGITLAIAVAAVAIYLIRKRRLLRE